MITFRLPSQLQPLAERQRSVQVDASTLAQAFERLDAIAPMLRSQVFEANGSIRRFVGIFLNGRQIGSLQAEPQALPEGSQITIVMAVAGG